MRYTSGLVAAALLAAPALVHAQIMPNPSPGEYFGRDTARVQRWYQQYLGRNPDPGGLQYYVGRLEAGDSPVELRAWILASDEFYKHWGGTPGGFINGLYRVVLGRLPSRQEVWYWKNQLWRNSNREQAALAVLDSSLEPGSGNQLYPFRRYGFGYPQ